MFMLVYGLLAMFLKAIASAATWLAVSAERKANSTGEALEAAASKADKETTARKLSNLESAIVLQRVVKLSEKNEKILNTAAKREVVAKKLTSIYDTFKAWKGTLSPYLLGKVDTLMALSAIATYKPEWLMTAFCWMKGITG